MRRRVRRPVNAWHGRGKPRLHFLHASKTGGTAIKHVLRQERATRDRMLLHSHAVTMREIPVGERAVLVVPDPVARFVSGFNSRLRRGGTAHPRDWSPAEAATFARFPTAESLALALHSSDPEEAGAAAAAMSAVLHLRRHQVHWVVDLDTLRSRQDDVLVVGRQWALAEDFARLSDLIGLDTHTLPTNEATAHPTPSGFATGLSDEARAAVRRWYADDYAFLAELERLGPAVGFLGELPPQVRG